MNDYLGPVSILLARRPARPSHYPNLVCGARKPPLPAEKPYVTVTCRTRERVGERAKAAHICGAIITLSLALSRARQLILQAFFCAGEGMLHCTTKDVGNDMITGRRNPNNQKTFGPPRIIFNRPIVFTQSLLILFTCSISFSSYANALPVDHEQQELHTLPGFFRLSFDNQIQMPNQITDMGLAGFDYFANVTPNIYAGFGGYGSVTGTQGGLFTVGVEGGFQHELLPHWWSDIGFFIGGGGGKASLTGGGLMIRPHAGIAYDMTWAKLGVFYSYIDFPNGQIRSQQYGLNLDIPMSLSYLSPHDNLAGSTFDITQIRTKLNQYIGFQRNDFALYLQAYRQRSGTKNTAGSIQDQTMGLVGAELDHYFTDKRLFWWLKTSGAFSGIPNGYMDVVGGLGYQIPLGTSQLSLKPQFGLGAGGGGLVETGGGFLVNPLLGIEWAATPAFSFRVSSGYLWAPQGELSAVPLTGELICHLDMATKHWHPIPLSFNHYYIQGWRFQILNQTYTHPQRSLNSVTSPIELIGIQVDQLFTPWFYLSYQAAGAYSGFHAGGYATGMIGAGVQSKHMMNNRIQLFTTLFLGAGGGGGLALAGGALIEPLVGIRYAFTPLISAQASVGELKALRDNLNTPIVNLGLAMRFDTLNAKNRHKAHD